MIHPTASKCVFFFSFLPVVARVFGTNFSLSRFFTLIASDVAEVLSCNGKVLTHLTDLLLIPCDVPSFSPDVPSPAANLERSQDRCVVALSFGTKPQR
ncbi:hypothetical protein PAHAL_5G217000 [Panicum hallii]|jgi:hypothetical protein|uniref:Uncharacterized protein n=1 Tax=Panicum hallii TaxID=206008 RepID=A0A2T8IKS4_9POAL|nr:hypothetical protein PAHAL_5G217000 [Panicum hallii]